MRREDFIAPALLFLSGALSVLGIGLSLYALDYQRSADKAKAEHPAANPHEGDCPCSCGGGLLTD